MGLCWCALSTMRQSQASLYNSHVRLESAFPWSQIDAQIMVPLNHAGMCAESTYIAFLADGSAACRMCPDNSISTSTDSPACVCIQGYYRNLQEDINGTMHQ